MNVNWRRAIAGGLALWMLLPAVASADNCGSLLDCFSTLRAALAALGGLLVVLSIVLDFVPVVGTIKGVFESITGRDLVTGEELSWWERALGIVPFLGVASVGRHLDDIADLGRTADRADEASDLGRAAGRADEVDEARGFPYDPDNPRQWDEFKKYTGQNKERFVPSQDGWKNVDHQTFTPLETDLFNRVLTSDKVLAGRTTTIQGQGMFNLPQWLHENGLRWSQRYQDVYNRGIYERTAAGVPVHVIGGGGFTQAEAQVAEMGAEASGINNIPFWPNWPTP
jgi:hypothetical protein